MREDCPKELPNVPDGYSNMHPSLLLKEILDVESGEVSNDGRNGNTWWIPGQQPTSEFHRSLVVAASQLCNVPLDDIDQYLVDQETCGQFLMDCVSDFMEQNGAL